MCRHSLLAQTPVEIKYESEICWGDVQDSKWQPLVITYSIVTGTISTHKYNSKTGLQTWEAISCDDATKKVVFSFNIASIPNNLKFWYYYVRLRGCIETGGVKTYGEWSPVSDWVSIQEIGKPSKPVGK